jgi:hypothetical protein
MLVSGLLKDLMEELVEVWDQEDTQAKVRERVLDPLIVYVTDKMYPYVMVTVTVGVLLLLLLGMILFLLLTRSKTKTS